MSMTYKQIVDAVLDAGFDDGLYRASAQQWVQFRHAWLWDLEEWTFKETSSAVVFTANSQIVGSVPSDFHAATGLYTSQGLPLQAFKDHREFFDRYNTNLSLGASTPEAYTVYGGQVLVGPKGDGSAGLVLYEKSKPTLANDGDTTGLPDGYDLALVHGGKAEGFKLTNVPLWSGFDDDFTAAANALRRNYLIAVKEQGAQQLGAFRPGQQWR